MAMEFGTEKAELLADASVQGRAFCEAYTTLIDSWLCELFDTAVGDGGGVALVGLGGHGRRELTPGGDIDLMVLHDGTLDPEQLTAFWYPIWDQGLKLGHSARTSKETLALAKTDLPTATSLLSARTLLGDDDRVAQLSADVDSMWRRRSGKLLGELSVAVAERHAEAPEVAFALEPDLKEGRGGLRDVQAIQWAQAAGVDPPRDMASCLAAYEELLAVRVALHRVTGRMGDQLALQEQDAVASHVGLESADDLMTTVASAGRTIAWHSDEFWYDISSTRSIPRPLRRRSRELREGVTLDEGRIHIAADGELGPAAATTAAALAAHHDARLEEGALELVGATSAPGQPWSAELRGAFVSLLSAGDPAVAVAESLDHVGFWERLVPEWPAVRSKPQRNAYHRFTVDRHLLETAVQASALVDRVDRPDLLVMAALFHDIGKGFPGDHTEVGMELIGGIGSRMGYEADDVATLQAMIEHHLLLPDAATRRDLDDPATVAHVAESVETVERLHLLHALTEADSIATSTAAWGAWKAGLVADLVGRTAKVLEGAEATEVVGTGRPDHWDELLDAADRSGAPQVHTDGERLTIVCADRRGVFSRVAGTLALSGLDVVDASATSERGFAVEEFQVGSRLDVALDWDHVVENLEKALTGRLAIATRLAERARSYPESPPQPAAFTPDVSVFADASDDATVIEVTGPDSIGLLYRLTSTMLDLDLDLTRAKVATLGHDVVDTFYVTDSDGQKVTDHGYISEIKRALAFALESS